MIILIFSLLSFYIILLYLINKKYYFINVNNTELYHYKNIQIKSFGF